MFNFATATKKKLGQAHFSLWANCSIKNSSQEPFKSAWFINIVFDLTLANLIALHFFDTHTFLLTTPPWTCKLTLIVPLCKAKSKLLQ
jgi:hypothetical protein